MYFLSHISIHAPFLLFHLNFIIIKDYLLLIYTFMCMIIFLRIIILSFQSRQTRILREWRGIGKDCPVLVAECPGQFSTDPVWNFALIPVDAGTFFCEGNFSILRQKKNQKDICCPSVCLDMWWISTDIDSWLRDRWMDGFYLDRWIDKDIDRGIVIDRWIDICR